MKKRGESKRMDGCWIFLRVCPLLLGKREKGTKWAKRGVCLFSPSSSSSPTHRNKAVRTHPGTADQSYIDKRESFQNYDIRGFFFRTDSNQVQWSRINTHLLPTITLFTSNVRTVKLDQLRFSFIHLLPSIQPNSDSQCYNSTR